jgi:hypothetical protein
VHAKDQYGRRMVALPDPFDHLDPAEARHGYVKKENVTRAARKYGEYFSSIFRLADDSNIRYQGKYLVQSFPHDVVIVRKNNSNHHGSKELLQ